MERKIGEIFKYNGEWYQCVESRNCGECSLFTTRCGSGTKNDLADKIFGKECSKEKRSDNRPVIFKKLEKVGEPYVKRISDGTFSTFQRYRVYNSVILPKEPYIYCNFIDGTIEIEIKQTKEDMEEKKIQHYDCFFNKSDKSDKSDLKPFDLEAAKDGKPVCTRDGRKARIICYDRQCDHGFPLVVLVENPGAEKDEDVRCYRSSGTAADPGDTLMMLPEKHEGWVNVFNHGNNDTYVGNFIFPTEKLAKEAVSLMNGVKYFDTVKIEWEE